MPKRKLPKLILDSGREIDLDELMAALESNTHEIHWFFNSATGEVESYSEDYPSREQFEKDMEEIEKNNDMHPIPKLESWESYKFKEDFNEEIVKRRDKLMYEKLVIALDGQGAFWRFEDVLHGDAELLDKWYAYKDEKLIEEAGSWLESLGVKFN